MLTDGSAWSKEIENQNKNLQFLKKFKSDNTFFRTKHVRLVNKVCGIRRENLEPTKTNGSRDLRISKWNFKRIVLGKRQKTTLIQSNLSGSRPFTNPQGPWVKEHELGPDNLDKFPNCSESIWRKKLNRLTLNPLCGNYRILLTQTQRLS